MKCHYKSTQASLDWSPLSYGETFLSLYHYFYHYRISSMMSQAPSTVHLLTEWVRWKCYAVNQMLCPSQSPALSTVEDLRYMHLYYIFDMIYIVFFLMSFYSFFMLLTPEELLDGFSLFSAQWQRSNLNLIYVRFCHDMLDTAVIITPVDGMPFGMPLVQSQRLIGFTLRVHGSHHGGFLCLNNLINIFNRVFFFYYPIYLIVLR